jgi:hypothetical protein
MFRLDLWEKAAECQRALERAESNQRQILTNVRDLGSDWLMQSLC